MIFPVVMTAQSGIPTARENNSQTILPAENPSDAAFESDFRVEKIQVAGGAEIITIFAKLQRTVERTNYSEEVPLVSVLRDTLGDETVENDRLRRVWILTYTKPSLAQRFAAAVPFLYMRTTNKQSIGTGAPPAIIDLNPSENAMWDKIFWRIFKNLALGDFGTPVRLATLQYKTNVDDYRKSAVARALAVLALYQAIEGKEILTAQETKDIQARMLLSQKTLGGLVQSENLERVYQSNVEKTNDFRGHNWELLRQYSEAQGLYFEPLQMPDGSATHALVWTATEDLATNKNRKFESRFLNIKNPWNDKRLDNWDGYSEVRWFDEDNRIVEPNTPNAKPKRMIPLALYGLDYPKIPTLLIDFRDRDNPKRREMSKRVLDDLTKNVLSLSQFASVPYFVGRYMYSFVTGRRGIDFNQASRVNSYSQLKLLLALNESLDPQFRSELTERAEYVSVNPLENDSSVEIQIARQQYENLIAFAKRPDGLPAQIERERREEMTRLKHGGKAKVMFDLGHVLSLGLYTHREDDTPELRAGLDARRRLDYYKRYLRETARETVKPEIDGDTDAIRRSLEFISQNGESAGTKTVEAIAQIFAATEDKQIRELCLSSLNRIKDKAARKKLQLIYENTEIDLPWRNIAAGFLNSEKKEDKQNQAIKAESN